MSLYGSISRSLSRNLVVFALLAGVIFGTGCGSGPTQGGASTLSSSGSSSSGSSSSGSSASGNPSSGSSIGALLTAVHLPDGVATVGVNATTNTVYVLDPNYPSQKSGSLIIVDGKTNTVEATISTPSYPRGIAVDESANTVYISNYLANSLTVLNGATNAITATIPVGNGPSGVAVDSATHLVYVANFLDGTVSVISTQTAAVVATVPVGFRPAAAAVNSTAGLVYIANSGDQVTSSDDGTVSVIAEQTNRVVNVWTAGKGPTALAFDQSNNCLYVANFSDVPTSTVTVLDAISGTIRSTISVGVEPNGIVLDGATQTLYVSNLRSENISVIDAATGGVESESGGFIGVGSSYGIAVNSVTHAVYVTENHLGEGGTIDNSYGTLNVFQGAVN